MKRKTLHNLLFYVVGISILASWFYYEINKKQRIVAKLAIEYPLITIDEEIFGQITGIYKIDPKLFRINTNSREITIDHKLKRRLNVDNELFTGKNLHDVLVIGDVVLKYSDSTSVSLFRIKGADTLEFRFPLLNEKLHPLK
jgi:hypothetical protein